MYFWLAISVHTMPFSTHSKVFQMSLVIGLAFILLSFAKLCGLTAYPTEGVFPRSLRSAWSQVIIEVPADIPPCRHFCVGVRLGCLKRAPDTAAAGLMEPAAILAVPEC